MKKLMLMLALCATLIACTACAGNKGLELGYEPWIAALKAAEPEFVAGVCDGAKGASAEIKKAIAKGEAYLLEAEEGDLQLDTEIEAHCG